MRLILASLNLFPLWDPVAFTLHTFTHNLVGSCKFIIYFCIFKCVPKIQRSVTTSGRQKKKKRKIKQISLLQPVALYRRQEFSTLQSSVEGQPLVKSICLGWQQKKPCTHCRSLKRCRIKGWLKGCRSQHGWRNTGSTWSVETRKRRQLRAWTNIPIIGFCWAVNHTSCNKVIV